MNKMRLMSRSLVLVSLFLVACPTMARTAKSTAAIRGTVQISAELKNNIAPTAALYIIARPNGQTTGAPVAVKRYVAPFKFPIHFELTDKDAMIPNTPFKGSFTIVARISQTGSAMPATTGDLETSKPLNNVKPGKKPIKLVLDQLKK
jgi:hypothetical protein